jgi:hypothetical protein
MSKSPGSGAFKGTKIRVVCSCMRLSQMSNEQVVASLRALVGEGNRIVAKIVAYLVEVEERRIHLELACSSMFDFAVRKLGFSNGEAFRRITAARLARRFPRIIDAIASGRVHLSNLVLLRDHFSEENVEELLERAAGKSKREVEELVARLAPKPDVASSIRKVPERVVLAVQSPLRAAAVGKSPTPTPQVQVQPLSEARYRVQLTASAQLRDKLEHARRLMSHRHPSGDLAAVVEEALDLLIEKLEKAKLGKTDRPRESTRPSTSPPKDAARVTAAARREVVSRDGLQCSFIGMNGERCPAREHLEFDHRMPRALGGTGEAANVRLLCRSHNRLAAEQVFGREYVAERIDLRQKKCGTGVETKERVRGALRAMGFRVAEAERAITTLDAAGWDDRPIELLVRDAIGAIT